MSLESRYDFCGSTDQMIASVRTCCFWRLTLPTIFEGGRKPLPLSSILPQILLVFCSWFSQYSPRFEESRLPQISQRKSFEKEWWWKRPVPIWTLIPWSPLLNIWIVDDLIEWCGADKVAFFTTRMTVIKLANGQLWCHSPINKSSLVWPVGCFT